MHTSHILLLVPGYNITLLVPTTQSTRVDRMNSRPTFPECPSGVHNVMILKHLKIIEMRMIKVITEHRYNISCLNFVHYFIQARVIKDLQVLKTKTLAEVELFCEHVGNHVSS